ncbi:hypothetical protein EMPG_10120 [Blastomyces silverae]|uniref:Uncharacterized protein n=1 Tax=Blastomyces silverae TaxID=2060906 RepID=A0A0H1B5X8_9EURO|nr:hypothetical protein EMPG_10120 [Blastomyces silverae]
MGYLPRRLRMGKPQIPLPPRRLRLHHLDRPHPLPRLHQGFAGRHGRRRLHHAPRPRLHDRHQPSRHPRRDQDESHDHAAVHHHRR